MSKKACIILAAGQGKRMNNPEVPKVLAPLSNKPLLWYVFEQIKPFMFDKVFVITGYKRNSVDGFIQDYNLTNCEVVHQLEQLGTGHAVAQAKEKFTDVDCDVLILCGDVPLLQNRTIGEVFHFHYQNDSDVTVVSSITENPTGYGRIIRDENKNFIKITEEKDASDSEKSIKEVNSGIYVVKSKLLFSALEKVSNQNNQNEYYLTDIIGILKSESKKVMAEPLVSFDEIQGINTADDLARAEKYLKYMS
jgi:bifunctional UDP-N-acetylglucosamine pyrophosphorylase/glucosamine-1-phosphate N-acetyltransferase